MARGPLSSLAAPEHGRAFVLEVADEAASSTLLASLPLLDRLLAEKLAAVREQRMGEMVDFMAARLLAPTQVDWTMAQRLAERHARILNEFGYYTAEQLADANGSQASNRAALADARPIRAVQQVLEAFGGRKSPWKLALWFTSNHGALPGSARPVDLLAGDAQAVVRAALQDAQGSAA